MPSTNQHIQTNSDQETLRLPAAKGPNPFGALKGLTAAASLLCATEPALGQLPQQGQVAGQTFVRDGVVMVVGNSFEAYNNFRPEKIPSYQTQFGAGAEPLGATWTGNTLGLPPGEYIVRSYAELLMIGGPFIPKEYTFNFSVFDSAEKFFKDTPRVKVPLVEGQGSFNMSVYTNALPFTFPKLPGETNYVAEIRPNVGEWIVGSESVLRFEANIGWGSSIPSKWWVDLGTPTTNGVVTLKGGDSTRVFDQTGQKVLCSRLEVSPIVNLNSLPPAPKPSIQVNGKVVVVNWVNDGWPIELQCSSLLNGSEIWTTIPTSQGGAGTEGSHEEMLLDGLKCFRIKRPF